MQCIQITKSQKCVQQSCYFSSHWWVWWAVWGWPSSARAETPFSFLIVAANGRKCHSRFGIPPDAAFPAFAAAGREAAGPHACQEGWSGECRFPCKESELASANGRLFCLGAGGRRAAGHGLVYLLLIICSNTVFHYSSHCSRIKP